MKIGSCIIEGKLALAPMAQVTSLPFRVLCKRYGCSLVYSEMINSVAVVRRNKATLRRASMSREERPVAMQLFGTRPEEMLEAAKILEADIIDLNCGCPDISVMKQGAGAALLKRPKRIGEIVEALARSTKPVTVKIRTGLDKEHINAVEVARICESAGASAIAVHGRNLAQKYTGKADWDIIRQVKKSVGIPVIANGDIKDEMSAKACLEATGADMLMIGRAAIGEPYIFKRIQHYLGTGEMLPRQSIDEKIADFLEFHRLAIGHGCLTYPELKTHAQWFTRNTKQSSGLRDRIAKAMTIEEIMEIMERIESQTS